MGRDWLRQNPYEFAYIHQMAKTKKLPKVKVESSKVVYRGPAFWVTTDHVVEPSGVRTRRDIVHHSGSVVILVADDSRPEPKVLLERQYRHAAQQFLWELPAGRKEQGEDELLAAKRELLEETGYSATKWKRILRYFASPGFLAEPMSVFLAQGLKKGKAQPEADEVISVRFFPLARAVRMINNGTVRDAKTIASLLWLAQARTGQKARR
jgi:ADP-ribose pyrophosphatase